MSDVVRRAIPLKSVEGELNTLRVKLKKAEEKRDRLQEDLGILKIAVAEFMLRHHNYPDDAFCPLHEFLTSWEDLSKQDLKEASEYVWERKPVVRAELMEQEKSRAQEAIREIEGLLGDGPKSRRIRELLKRLQ